MKAIDRITVAEATARALRQMIVSGELPAGEPLRQEDLAARLGVSRTPLREAIARLDAQGLVKNDPHKGAIVYRPNVRDLHESFEIQGALEPLAARLAAENATDEDLKKARQLLDGFQRMKSADAWADHNEAFHLALYRMARRPKLYELIAQQYERSKIYVRILVGAGDAPRAEDEHEAMVDALEHRRGAVMERLLRDHVRGTVRSVSARLEGRGG